MTDEQCVALVTAIQTATECVCEQLARGRGESYEVDEVEMAAFMALALFRQVHKEMGGESYRR